MGARLGGAIVGAGFEKLFESIRIGGVYSLQGMRIAL